MVKVTFTKFESGKVLLDRYEIVEMLGAGGNGLVYKVKDTLGEGDETRIRALKVAKVTDTSARFLQEIRIAQEASHENLIRIYDSGRLDEEYYYCTMEYMSGGSLEEYLKTNSIEFPQLVSVLKNIASALGMLHANGIIHRDLKPANILLPENFPQSTDVKITDLGLAKNQRREIELTQGEGSMMGTIAYMSPEQAHPRRRLKEGEELDGRTDIFAFGLIAYEMATGKHAYEQSLEDMADVVRELLSDDEIGEIPKKQVPSWFSTLVSRCLRKSREERYERISEVETALEEGKVGFHWRSTKGRVLSHTIAATISMLVAVMHVYMFVEIPNLNTGYGYAGKYIDEITTNTLFKVRGEIPIPEDVVVIAHDEKTYKELGERIDKPWPRKHTAALLERLGKYKPKAIYLDYYFFPNYGDDESNARLAKAMTLNTTYIPKLKGKKGEWVYPEPKFTKASAGLFEANNLESGLGYIRTYNYNYDNLIDSRFYHLELGEGDVPDQRALINYYSNPANISTVSYHEIVKGDEDLSDKIDGKYVWVGVVFNAQLSKESDDTYRTIFNSELPGVYIHATKTENLLRDDWIRSLRADKTFIFNFMLAAVLVYTIMVMPAVVGLWTVTAMIAGVPVVLYLGFLNNYYFQSWVVVVFAALTLIVNSTISRIVNT